MSADLQTVARDARPIFEKLEPTLLADHRHAFISIEPVSEDYLIGDTLSDAIEKARQKYPDRLVHTFRLGHTAAVHFGMQIQ